MVLKRIRPCISHYLRQDSDNSGDLTQINRSLSDSYAGTGYNPAVAESVTRRINET
jgi:hypothetical protein